MQYFGKRYYAPLLNRWVSADPLAIHVPGEADLNLYAYVEGATLKATDPLGLAPEFEFTRRTQAEREAHNRAATKAAEAVLKHVVTPTICAFFGCGSTSTAATPGKPPTPAKTEAAKMLDTAAFVSGGRALVLLGKTFRFAKGAAIARPTPSLEPAKGLLQDIVGGTYARLIREGATEGYAMKTVTGQATVVGRFIDGGGKMRTAIATANREVWKDLSEAQSAGRLGDAELLPFVPRPNKSSPHPDVVLGKFAKSQGAAEITVASVPNTCHGCQAAIPKDVPSTTFETPKK